jgi:predicted lipoprotein with Yx(FWY)xxD motif
LKRILLLLAGIAILGLATSGVASAKSAPPTVKLAKRGGLGKILVTNGGFTLYMFTKDGHNKDNCRKISMCASIWPPLTVKNKPIAGPGVKKSLLGTIKLSNGKKQVTYNGHPLYTYSLDNPGDTGYVGQVQFNGTWLALNASGKRVG